jgi:hypothetical protein
MKERVRFYKSPGGRDEERDKRSRAEPAKRFDESLGNEYFQADGAIGAGAVVVRFFYDENARKNDGHCQPGGRQSGQKSCVSR